MAPENPRTHALCHERLIMARPKKEKKRDQQLNLGLTEDELKAVRARAFAAGMRIVDYARHLLLGGRNASARLDKQPTRIERLVIVQLKRLGNNLNQIARVLNTYPGPAPPSLEPLLRDIRRMLAKGVRHGS